MKGKLIVIEGVDGSGKTTQLKLLRSFFESKGESVESIHFPRHQEKFFGVVVDDYLNGKFGDVSTINPKLASILFACDRFEAKQTIINWLDQGKIVILDRYMTSNKGHEVGKLKTEFEKIEMLAWLDNMEYGVFGIPKPDYVFYLDVPFAEVRGMIIGRDNMDKEYIEGEFDQNEADDNHIQNAQKSYLFTANRYDYWHTIKCSENGEISSPEIIHECIVNLIK